MNSLLKDFRAIKLISSKEDAINSFEKIVNELNYYFKDVNCTFAVEELWQDQYDVRLVTSEVSYIKDKLFMRFIPEVNKLIIAKDYVINTEISDFNFSGFGEFIELHTIDDIVETFNSKAVQIVLYKLYQLLT